MTEQTKLWAWSVSALHLVVALVFDFIVAVILYLLGASLSTCWFTFLGLFGLATLAEIGLVLEGVNRKLDAILERQQTRGPSN